MRSLIVAAVALGIASAAFVSPAYSQFGPFGHDGRRGPVFVPNDFHRHNEWRERQAWREREEWHRRQEWRGRRWNCGWGCRRW
jgi:hypothetical protein